MIYVTNKTYDDTYLKMKQHIKIPVERVTYEKIEEYLVKLTEAKEDYHEITLKNLSNELDLSYAEEIMNTLLIDDFSQPVLHTIVLYDDAAEVFRNKKSRI